MSAGIATRRRGKRAPPGRVAYVDGKYLRHGTAAVHVEDRGLQFADSVYEVCAVFDGQLMDELPHLARLERSLGAIGMSMPTTNDALRVILRETIRRNRLKNGIVYLQVTRGRWPRDHVVPGAARPTIIVTARRIDPETRMSRCRIGVGVATCPDIRWGRCDIKSTALLPNVLAKTDASERGAHEAWFVDSDGMVTEGASTNAWIVTSEGVVTTRSLSNALLPGVTRAVLLKAASEAGLDIEERAFSVDESYGAQEAFLTSAGGGLIPVIAIDGRRIGTGAPGPIAARLRELYTALSIKDAAELPPKRPAPKR